MSLEYEPASEPLHISVEYLEGHDARRGIELPQLNLTQQTLGSDLGVPHGGLRPFHQKSSCLTQLTLGPCVVQIWSRYVQNLTQQQNLESHDARRGIEPPQLAPLITLKPRVITLKPRVK